MKYEIGGVKTYLEHDCLNWQSEHWGNNQKAAYTRCGVCNTITGFHYKSFWKRLRALFNFKASTPIKI